MSVYLHGDIHGDVFTNFSYKKNPQLRELTEDDFVIIAGDFGAIWDYNLNSKSDLNSLSWLNSRPWKTIVVLGNHECWTAYENMPHISPDFLYDGTLLQCQYMNQIFDNIYIVYDIAILNIENNHILCISGADSNDIDILLDPNESNYKYTARRLRKNNCWFRVIGQTWWPQEKINIEKCIDFLEDHENEHFDLIITHDAPATIYEWFGYNYKANDGQKYFKMLQNTLDYDCWCHGHFHFDNGRPRSLKCSAYITIHSYLMVNHIILT